MLKTDAVINPVWQDDVSSINTTLSTLGQRQLIAVDTEFMRTTTFLPEPAVMQLGDGVEQYLLAAEAIDKSSAENFFNKFSDLSDGATLIAHAAREDMEVFDCLSGVIPQNLFDTQIAAGFVGLEPTLSLQKIVDQLLGVELSKTESRTDWLQRPLTDNQIHYAAADVSYLIDVYNELKQSLDELGRIDWVMEDCQKRLNVETVAPAEYYKTYNNAWQLKGEKLARFKNVIEWRENYARDNNIARSRIGKDFILFSCVKDGVRSASGLRDAGVHPQAVRKYCAPLLDVLTTQADASEVADVELRRPLSKPEQSIVKLMRNLIAQKAEDLGVSAQVIASNKHCIALFYWYLENRLALVESEAPLPELFLGWRYDRITLPCIELLDEKLR